MNKKVSLSLLVTVVILAMTVTFSMTMVTSMRIFDKTVSSVKEKESMYQKLAEIDRYVRDSDYYTIDEKNLYDTLASGYILGSGDRYAKYYTAEAYNELQKIQSGSIVGVGAKVVKDVGTGYAKVVRVYTGSPAEELGITKGCYIKAVDGVDLKSTLSSEAMQKLLRGENGTVAELTWLDNTAGEHVDSVTRRSYARATVEYQMLEGNCGYVRIWDFTEKTASELDYALSALKGTGATSIVFDLRDNNSNNLTAAIESIDLVCPAGPIATAMYKDGTTQLIGFSEDTDKLDLPYACLVSGTTASGAELFAAAARTLSNAKLVGVTTAGKGAVQSETKMLSDGSAVVVTTASVLASDGTSFEDTGLTVDVERALTADELVLYYDYEAADDPQIQKAVKVAIDMAGGSTVGQENDGSAAQDTAADTADTADNEASDS